MTVFQLVLRFGHVRLYYSLFHLSFKTILDFSQTTEQLLVQKQSICVTFMWVCLCGSFVHANSKPGLTGGKKSCQPHFSTTCSTPRSQEGGDTDYQQTWGPETLTYQTHICWELWSNYPTARSTFNFPAIIPRCLSKSLPYLSTSDLWF